jgi:hypothetical protein
MRPVARAQYDIARSKFSEQRFDDISIYGRPPFVDYVIEALRELKAGYPYGYSLVHRYLRGIVDNQRVEGVVDGVRYEKMGPTGRLSVAPSRYAALLVRQAIVQRQVWGLSIPKNPRSHLISLQKELDAMRRLQCDPRHFHPQQNKILKLEKKIHNRRRHANPI